MSTPFRSRASALALPGIPLALLVGSFVSPTDSSDNAPQLVAAAAHGARWDVAAFCELVAAALFPLAAVGVARAVRGRLATVGAALAGLGSMGMAGIAFRHLFIYGLAAAPQATALHALDRVDDAVGPIVLLCMFAGPFALIALVTATVRAGYVGRWAVACAVLFFVSDMLPIPAAEELQGIVGIATFAFVAARLLERQVGVPQAEPRVAVAV